MRVLWQRMLTMLRCWRVLCSVKMMDGFDAVITKLERVVAQPERIMPRGQLGGANNLLGVYRSSDHGMVLYISGLLLMQLGPGSFDPRTLKKYADFERRDGLIKALSSNLDTLVKEAKKVEGHTPYEERKCLWGLQDKGWELKQVTYATLGEPPHPQPLLHFDAVTSLTEWINSVCDYSDAWLVGFMAYKSASFSLEESLELMENIHGLPCLKDVIAR